MEVASRVKLCVFQKYKPSDPIISMVINKMARRRKTGYAQSEWRRKFAEAVRVCKEEARRKGVRFQDCVRSYLKH